MAIKRIVTKVEHAKLPDSLKTEYKADDTGENFVLEIDGYEDPAELKRAKDHEKTARKGLEKQVKDLQDNLTALTEERDGLLRGAIPKADVEKLEGSYKTKIANREKELSTQIEALTISLNTTLVDNVALGLASKLSTSPTLLLPHIKSRLKAELKDGKAETRVLDAEGNISALTIEDFEKEILANKQFAPILTGSKGSGGGSHGSGSGGGAPRNAKTVTRDAFETMSHPDRAAFAKSGGTVTD